MIVYEVLGASVIESLLRDLDGYPAVICELFRWCVDGGHVGIIVGLSHGMVEMLSHCERDVFQNGDSELITFFFGFGASGVDVDVCLASCGHHFGFVSPGVCAEKGSIG